VCRSRWHSLVIDCNDLEREASFWQAVLGYERVHETPDEIELVAPDGHEPSIVLGIVPDERTAADRLRIALATDDQADEVERIIGVGATHADADPVDVPWVVLRSPDGNELCVLTPPMPR
jgi:catechol 2,3-dioxygenase-like lactoylglutathione lyase family enzyme